MMNKLYLQINKDGYITGWASMGSIENGIEADASLINSLDASIIGCQKYVDGKVITDHDLIATKEAKEAADREIAELKEWFAWYDNQICQYQRDIRLGKEFDKNITELDAEAAEKQARIRDLQKREE